MLPLGVVIPTKSSMSYLSRHAAGLKAWLNLVAEVAEALACDVVLSKPAFCNVAAQVLLDLPRPIDDVIGTLGIEQPRRLRQFEAVVFAAAHATEALTGSRASDLFRTEVLQRHPFATDFGTSGDAVWGRIYAAEVVWDVVPEKFSSFTLHPTNASAAEQQTFLTAQRADALLRAAMDPRRRSGVITEQSLPPIIWEDLMTSLASYFEAKVAFDRTRQGATQWVPNPWAWRKRILRELTTKQLQRLKHAALPGNPVSAP